jgi:hypothetical protein
MINQLASHQFREHCLILGFRSRLGVSFRPPALQPAKINGRF